MPDEEEAHKCKPGKGALTLEFTKRTDGGAVRKCIRAEGSTTWQRQVDKHAAFFPLHDLTHYAVETELGFRHGFYGLIAQGWDIEETTGKGARRSLPDEAIEVEYLVSAFTADQASGAVSTANEFNKLTATFAGAKRLARHRQLTEAELAKVRSRMDELFLRWRTLPPGQTLELVFAL